MQNDEYIINTKFAILDAGITQERTRMLLWIRKYHLYPGKKQFTHIQTGCKGAFETLGVKGKPHQV